MQENRVTAKILVISVVVLLLSAISISFLIMNKDDEVDKDKELADIERSLSIDERAAGIYAENISLSNLSGNFARGRLFDTGDGQEKDFYMIKIADVWRVVDITSSPVSCERFARLGFPNVFIQDCKLSFSDAVTLSQIDATLADFFLSAENVNLKIIGTVEFVEETENGQIVTLNSGGEIVQIQFGIDDDKINQGDLIVTNITPPNQNSTTNTSNTTSNQVVYTPTNTVVVNDPDKDLFEDQDNQTNVSEEDNNSTVEDKNKINKISAPKSSAPPSYFFNVNDVDNSFVDIELNGNF